MKTIMKAVMLIILLCMTNYSQENIKKQEYAHLFLTLGDGFIHGERIIIKVERSTGKDTTIFDNHINRISINSVNGFDIPIEKGRVNTVILICLERKVECKHAFLFYGNAYLEINVSLSNEFFLISSDQPFTYEWSSGCEIKLFSGAPKMYAECIAENSKT